MSMNKMFIVSHKRFNKPEASLYSPIYVGNGSFNLNEESYTDKTGMNISEKNKNYCELTALYWIWKNFTQNNQKQWIGFCHYRRYFFEKFSNNIENVITEKYIDDTLQNFDIILPKKIYLRRSVRNQYSFTNSGYDKDLDVLENIIFNDYPEYTDSFKKVMNRKWFYAYNMMICNNVIFNDYCSWLFDILFKVEKEIDISNYSDYQKRIYGFLSERLLNVYIDKNKLSVKELNVLNTESSMRDELIFSVKSKMYSWLY